MISGRLYEYRRMSDQALISYAYNLKAPFALFARLRHGIDFDAIDGEPVDIVVLLLLPEAGDSAKGNALACVARALRDAETLRKVRSAPDRDALFRVIEV